MTSFWRRLFGRWTNAKVQTEENIDTAARLGLSKAEAESPVVEDVRLSFQEIPAAYEPQEQPDSQASEVVPQGWDIDSGSGGDTSGDPPSPSTRSDEPERIDLPAEHVPPTWDSGLGLDTATPDPRIIPPTPAPDLEVGIPSSPPGGATETDTAREVQTWSFDEPERVDLPAEDVPPTWDIGDRTPDLPRRDAPGPQVPEVSTEPSLGPAALTPVVPGESPATEPDKSPEGPWDEATDRSFATPNYELHRTVDDLPAEAVHASSTLEDGVESVEEETLKLEGSAEMLEAVGIDKSMPKLEGIDQLKEDVPPTWDSDPVAVDASTTLNETVENVEGGIVTPSMAGEAGGPQAEHASSTLEDAVEKVGEETLKLEGSDEMLEAVGIDKSMPKLEGIDQLKEDVPPTWDSGPEAVDASSTLKETIESAKGLGELKAEGTELPQDPTAMDYIKVDDDLPSPGIRELGASALQPAVDEPLTMDAEWDDLEDDSSTMLGYEPELTEADLTLVEEEIDLDVVADHDLASDLDGLDLDGEIVDPDQ
ncbi:MAG: hypothetical protein OEM39_02515 [Acidimicrobiia bacterium]|nr:hypothetical protein [Acidimicrobiia bacterium]